VWRAKHKGRICWTYTYVCRGHDVARTLSASKLAKALGVSGCAPYNWARAGCPHDKDPVRFDLGEVQAWQEKRGRPAGKRGQPSTVERLRGKAAELAEGDSEEAKRAAAKLEEMANAEARKKHWDAVKSQLQALKLQGQLVPRDEVDRERLARIHAVVALMDAAPAKHARRFVGLASEAEAEDALRELLRGMREEFAR